MEPFADVRLNMGIQDASFYANVWFGCGTVRLSVFAGLAVILGEEACSSSVVAEVSKRIEAYGFTFVPGIFLGSPLRRANALTATYSINYLITSKAWQARLEDISAQASKSSQPSFWLHRLGHVRLFRGYVNMYRDKLEHV